MRNEMQKRAEKKNDMRVGAEFGKIKNYGFTDLRIYGFKTFQRHKRRYWF
jgi:hypothetical protein